MYLSRLDNFVWVYPESKLLFRISCLFELWKYEFHIPHPVLEIEGDLTCLHSTPLLFKESSEKNPQLVLILVTVPFKKTRFFGHLWCKMGWLHIEIKYLKSPNKILIFLLQIDTNQIFQMRYYMTFNVLYFNLKRPYFFSKMAKKPSFFERHCISKKV